MIQPQIDTLANLTRWLFELPDGYSASIIRIAGSNYFQMIVRDKAGHMVFSMPEIMAEDDAG